MKKKIARVFIVFMAVAAGSVAVGLGFLSSDMTVSGQQESRGWRVWVRTSPCSGRFDWLSVAKDDPTTGGNFYFSYEAVIAATRRCTLPAPQGCTFAEATALMEELRSHPKFLDYCCREYSVWNNSQTGKSTVVLGKLGTPGMGWMFVKGDLCCEQAESLGGIPGACSGAKAAASHWGQTNQNAGLNGKSLRAFPAATFAQCQAECDKNPSCKGCTLIRKGAYAPTDPSMCYLMSEATSFAPSPCCISAIKGGSTGGTDKCTCKDKCPDCAGLPSLLCEVAGETAKARACRQCMSTCQ